MNDLKHCRVLVTATSFGKGDPSLRRELEEQVGAVIYNPTTRPLTSAELAQLLPGCDGYIAGLDQVDAAALACADRLKVISRYGVGVDRVDLAAVVRLEVDYGFSDEPQKETQSLAERPVEPD